MRGELKNLARPLTRTYFHLIRRPSMIPQNLKRYRDFTHDFAYVYEVCSSYHPFSLLTISTRRIRVPD